MALSELTPFPNLKHLGDPFYNSFESRLARGELISNEEPCSAPRAGYYTKVDANQVVKMRIDGAWRRYTFVKPK